MAKKLLDEGSASVSRDSQDEPAATHTQQNNDERSPKMKYGCLIAIAIVVMLALGLKNLAEFIFVCVISLGQVCS